MFTTNKGKKNSNTKFIAFIEFKKLTFFHIMTVFQPILEVFQKISIQLKVEEILKCLHSLLFCMSLFEDIKAGITKVDNSLERVLKAYLRLTYVNPYNFSQKEI